MNGYPASLKVKIASWTARLLFREKIVVASNGRSGSTMLFEAIARSLIEARYPRLNHGPGHRLLAASTSGFVDRLSQVAHEPWPVLKTHDPFDSRYAGDARYLFIYGDPLEAALSVKKVVERDGHQWFSDHLNHLRGEGSYQELFTKDVLNYEQQLLSWQNADPETVLLLPYDKLWENQPRLVGFLGFVVQLPERCVRAEKAMPDLMDSELFERLRGVKRRLDQKLAAEGVIV